MYSDSFGLTTTLIYKYRLQRVCIQHWHQTYTIYVTITTTVIHVYHISIIKYSVSNAKTWPQIHKFRKILTILRNDSSGSNPSTKFSVLVVVAFTKKDNRYISKKYMAASRADTQPSSEYFRVRMRVILNL